MLRLPHARSAFLGASALVAGLALSGMNTADAAEPGKGPEVLDVKAPKAPTRPELRVNLEGFDFNLETKMFSFPSGLKILFQHDDQQPVVAVTAVTDHGASDDPIEKEGIAHLVEHLWFRSEQGELPKTWDMLESEMGCSLNAFTNYDFTVYLTVCPSYNLDALMRLESLRISSPIAKVTQDMVTTEIEVVRNEIRMRSENFNMPGFTLLEYSHKHMYPEGHPYQRPMAGDHTSIRNIVLEDIQAFTDAYYRPDTTTVTLVGDFAEDDFAYYYDLILRTFEPEQLHPGLKDEHIVRAPRPGVKNADVNNPEDWYLIALNPDNPEEVLPFQVDTTPRAKTYTNIVPPARVTDEIGTYEAPIERPTVTVTWAGPPGFQGNDFLYLMSGNMLNVVMGWGLNMSKEPQIGKFTGCWSMPSKHATSVICSAEVKTTDEREAQRIGQRMIDQLSLIYDPDLRSTMNVWFSQAKMNFLSGVLKSLDLYAAVGSGRSSDIGQFAHMTNDSRYHSAQMQSLNKVQSDEVVSYISKWLTRDRASIALLTPMDRDEVALMSEDTAGAGGHYRGGDEEAILNPTIAIDAITPEFLRNLMVLPDVAAIDDFVLPNGMRVVTVDHSDAPIVNVRMMAKGGSAHDANGEISFADTFSEMRPSNDPLMIAGDFFDLGMGQTTQQLNVKVPAGNLDGALFMLRDAMDQRHVDFDGLGRWTKGMKGRLKGNWRNIDWHVRDMRNEHVNPGHILTESLGWDDIEALSKSSSKDVDATLSSVWHPENTTLLIVGNVDQAQARELAINTFGGWKPKGKAQPIELPEIPGSNPAADQKIHVFDAEGKTQTMVQLVCPLQPAESTNSPAHTVLGTLGRMTLFTRLREEAGVVYSPYAGTFVQPGGGAMLFMQADIQNDSAVFAMEQYLRYIEEVKAGKFAEHDMRMKQLASASGYVVQGQSIDQMTSRLLEPLAAGEDWDFFENYADALTHMEKEDLSALVEGCAEHAYIALKGPKDTLEELLQDGGYEYEVVDWEQRGRDLWAEADPKGFAKAEKKRLKAEAKKKAAEEEKAEDESSDENADEGSEESGDEPVSKGGDESGDESSDEGDEG